MSGVPGTFETCRRFRIPFDHKNRRTNGLSIRMTVRRKRSSEKFGTSTIELCRRNNSLEQDHQIFESIFGGAMLVGVLFCGCMQRTHPRFLTVS